MKSRGLLIVFEGLDKSGKSTQSKLLYDALTLKNFQCELWRFPNRTTSIGQLINLYLTKKIEQEDHVVHLLFSANRWEQVNEMKNKLYNGITLILDRYAYSGVAYTAAKYGFDIEWCKQCDMGLPKADLVCFMDNKSINVDTSLGDERYENIEFQQIVNKNFKNLFNLNEKLNNDCLVLNAGDKIEDIQMAILNHVLNVYNHLHNTEISYLWN
jgi:dTMP kinase